MGSPGLRGGRTSSSLEVLLVTPPAVPMFPGSVVRLMAGGFGGGEG